MIKHIQHMLPPQWAVLLAALLTLLQPSFAQSPAVSCDRGNYTVVFVNGVWNDEPEDVAISLLDLRNRVGAGLRKGRPLDFKYIFNSGQGIIEDVEETFRVAAASFGVDHARLWAGFDSEYFEERGETLTAEQKKAIDEFYLKTAAEEAALYLDKISESEPDFVSAVAQLRNPKFLPRDNSLILVGHSEGSIFTQLLYTSLLGSSTPRDDNSMRLLSVGAAATKVPGRSNADAPPDGEAWVTNKKDDVIALLRAVRIKQGKLQPLQANVEGDFSLV